MRDQVEVDWSLADLVKSARSKLGLSIGGVACAAHVSPNAVLEAERGELEASLANVERWSLRKRRGATSTIIRLIEFCGANPQAFLAKYSLGTDVDYIKNHIYLRTDEEVLGFMREVIELKHTLMAGVEKLSGVTITLEQAENLTTIVRATASKSISLGTALVLLGLYPTPPPSS